MESVKGRCHKNPDVTDDMLGHLNGIEKHLFKWHTSSALTRTIRHWNYLLVLEQN